MLQQKYFHSFTRQRSKEGLETCSKPRLHTSVCFLLLQRMVRLSRVTDEVSLGSLRLGSLIFVLLWCEKYIKNRVLPVMQ